MSGSWTTIAFLVYSLLLLILLLQLPLPSKGYSLRQAQFQEPTDSLELCQSNLQKISKDDQELDSAEFIEFLALQSNGNLDYDTFSAVPLPLITAFYTAACLDGRDCKNRRPTVSLSNNGVSGSLMELFCRQVDEFILNTVTIHFLYLIRYRNGLFADELLDGANNNTVVKDLKNATMHIVLGALECPVERQLLRRSHKSVSEITHVARFESQSAVDEGASQLWTKVTLSSVDRRLDDCPFRIEITIGNVIDYGMSYWYFCADLENG